MRSSYTYFHRVLWSLGRVFFAIFGFLVVVDVVYSVLILRFKASFSELAAVVHFRYKTCVNKQHTPLANVIDKTHSPKILSGNFRKICCKSTNKIDNRRLMIAHQTSFHSSESKYFLDLFIKNKIKR